MKLNRIGFFFFAAACAAAALAGCGGGGNGSNGGDADEETLEEAPAKIITLRVKGNLKQVYDYNMDTCSAPVPVAGDDPAKYLQDEGEFDMLSYSYGGKHYGMNLFVYAEQIGGGEDEAPSDEVVKLNRIEIKYDAPPTWTTTAIPDQNVELSAEVPVGGNATVVFDLFDGQSAKLVNSILDSPNLNPPKEMWAGMRANITLVGYAESGAEIRGTFAYGLKICKGCVVSKASPASICCTTDADPNEKTRMQNFRRFLSTLPDQNVRCHLFYDNDIIYCSWMKECYDELGCASVGCAK